MTLYPPLTMRRAPFLFALLLVVGAALALRLPRLAVRPLHNDEAVNTVKFNELWHGEFRYDPVEYHGPTLYYLTLPFVWVSGAKDFAATTEVVYRMVPVLFGVGLILLLLLVTDGLGRGGVLWAGLFTAVSPAFVFYSRYYIHEMPLVFFAFASIACGWRYRRSKRLGWAVLCGVSVGLTYATKETWVLALAAAAASAVTAATIWHYLLKGPGHRLHFRSRALLVGAGAFALVFFILFSGFFSNPRGPWDAIRTYFIYSQRAAGGGAHDHAWNYYLSLLLYSNVKGGPVWTEAAIVGLSVVGFLLAVFRRVHAHHTPGHPDHVPFSAYPPFIRFIGFYTLFLTIAFSIIPYKTPWCLLGFLHGMILLAGFACGQMVHALPNRSTKVLGVIVLLVPVAHLARQADRATSNFADAKHPSYFEAHPYNPYVYAHTNTGLKGLTDRVAQLLPFTPRGPQTQIAVIGDDYWPLPFYFRSYPNVGYWREPPAELTAPFIVSEAKFRDALAAQLDDRYVPEDHGLRPRVKLTLWVAKSVYDRFMETRR